MTKRHVDQEAADYRPTRGKLDKTRDSADERDAKETIRRLKAKK